jgi:hypothetical protein
MVGKVSGGVGYAVAPAAALVIYWVCVLFSPDRLFGHAAD